MIRQNSVLSSGVFRSHSNNAPESWSVSLQLANFGACAVFWLLPLFVFAQSSVVSPISSSPSPSPRNGQTLGVIYVDANATGANTGYSWNSAFTDLESALSIAVEGDEIWVADGVYTPSRLLNIIDQQTPSTNPRDAVFELRRGVRLFGGFAGGESTLAERAGLFRQTVLTGEIGDQSTTLDNSYHVVFFNSDRGQFSPEAVIDGFTIQGGRAEGLHPLGGGLVAGDFSGSALHRANLVVQNSIFVRNYARKGGAVWSLQHNGSFRRVSFIENEAEAQGGAVFSSAYAGADHGFVYCTFIRNVAGRRGGALYRQGGLPAHNHQVVNSLFAENSAESGGAILYEPQGIDNAAIPGRWFSIIGSLFYGNSADRGGALWISRGEEAGWYTIAPPIVEVYSSTIANNQASVSGGAMHIRTGGTPATVTVINSIIWGNTAPSGAQASGEPYQAILSDVEGGATGPYPNLILNEDPLFVDSAGGDFRVLPNSPAKFFSIFEIIPSDIFDVDGDGNTDEPTPLDLAGVYRDPDPDLIFNIDMGAFAIQRVRQEP